MTIVRLRGYAVSIHLREATAIFAAILLYNKRLFDVIKTRRGQRPSRLGADADKALAARRRVSPFLARSSMSTMLAKLGFVVRKGTTKHVPDFIDNVRMDNQKIRLAQDIKKYGVPKQLVMNMDESGYYLEGTSDSTFEVEGVGNVPIRGHGARAQVTIVETMCADGTLLPAQIIFNGTTDRVLPTETVPGVQYSKSANHWANATTTLEWAKKILVPAVKERRALLNKPKQIALLLLDSWHAHFNEIILKYLAQNLIKVVPVEPNLTGRLQPCDHQCGTNRLLKQRVLSAMDSDFLLERVCQQLGIEYVAPELTLSMTPAILSGLRSTLSNE